MFTTLRSLARAQESVLKTYGSAVLRHRCYATLDKCASPPSKGLILGIYRDEDDMFDTGTFTPAGARYNEVGFFFVSAGSWNVNVAGDFVP